jgi:heme exporter protein CcmD
MIDIYNFFNMGGYGLYVWLSFGFASLIMIFLLVKSYKDNKYSSKLLEELKSETKKYKEKNAR